MIQETIDFNKKINKKTIKESIMILWNRMPDYHEFNVYKFIQGSPGKLYLGFGRQLYAVFKDVKAGR